MDTGKDEFSQVLDEAISRPGDDIDDFTLESSAEEAHEFEKPANSNGGDIDDDREQGTPRIDFARENEAKIAQAEQSKQQWAAYYQQQESALKAAQEAYRASRKKTLEDDSETNLQAEEAAMSAVMEARLAIEKARDGYQKWDEHLQQLSAVPKLSAAEQAWLQANPQYLSDSRFAETARKAMSELKDQGLDPTHQTFYRRLDERLRAPGRMGQNSRRIPGAPAVRTTSRSGESVETMTPKDAEFIHRLGRNPNDPQVKAQWLQSKANTRRIAQQRGAFR